MGGLLPKLLASLLIGGSLAWVLERGGLALIPESAAFDSLAWWTIPAALLTNLLSTYYRTCRWIHLLRPIAPGLSEPRVLGVGFVGFTAVVLAPLRTGELVRPYLLSRDGEVTFAQALGATVAERVIDGLVVTVSLLLALLATTPLSPLPDHLGNLPLDIALVPRAAQLALVVFVGAFGAMLFFHWKRELALGLTGRGLGVVSPRLAAFVVEKVGRLADGLRALPSRRHFVPFLRGTVGYYAALGIGHWAMLVGCGIPATFGETWVVLGVMSIGILLPAGPGFFGAYQFSIYCSLAMFFPERVTLTEGSAFVFISYVAQLVVTLLSCAVGFFLMHLHPPKTLLSSLGASKS